MNKITKLKICNWSLLLFTVAILISGIQLEATHSNGIIAVWIHIIIGLLFMYIAATHIFLHFGYCNWFSKFRKLKSQFNRILWWISLFTLITGLVATIHWTATFTHAPIGGVHGKLGFLMILLSAIHIFGRIKFFKERRALRNC